MKMPTFKSIFPLNQKQIAPNGFTLVEISIVMIIIGLLIGGIFGGIRLIDNANVQKTIQDLKAVESSTLSFRDAYRALPGDIRNANTRLPNCTVAPCSTSGDGNRRIGTAGYSTAWGDAVIATTENATFWHHLHAADFLSMGIKNTTDMNVGEGTPEAAIGGGYKLSAFIAAFHLPNTVIFQDMIIFNTTDVTALFGATQTSTPCSIIATIDRKIDDGFTVNGRVYGLFNCGTAVITDQYSTPANVGSLVYDLKGF